jgi:hypothetical protein
MPAPRSGWSDALIRAHVFSADRVHGDDTPVPVLARHQTRLGRLWIYVPDDRPFVGSDPPAAVFFYSRDRAGEHPDAHLAFYAGILQADAYAGFNRLYVEGPVRARSPRPPVGRMADGISLCSPMSPPRSGLASCRWSRRWPSKRSSASMRSSTSSGRSMVIPLKSAWQSAASVWHRW